MENEIFYHYFSGNEYSINNLLGGNITFSHINYFNDPCEIALLPDEELFVTKNSDMRYKYEVLVRVFCFSQTFKNPLMWGHYGNSHEGFCVGYDKKEIENIPEFKDNICFGPVKYSDEIPLLSDEDIINGYAVFCKSSDWANEQEWHACIYLPSDKHSVISESEFLEKQKNGLRKRFFLKRLLILI